MREKALEALIAIPHRPFLIESVAKRLAHPEGVVRQTAVELLRRTADTDLVCDLALPYLSSLSAGTRRAAIQVLAGVAAGKARALSALEASLHDEHAEVRQEALGAICALERCATSRLTGSDPTA